MLADRLGFPDLLAVVRSWIALVKYIFNFSSGFWAITAGIVLLIRKKS
jgi:hypothetical protein